MSLLRTKHSQQIYDKYLSDGGLSGDCKLCARSPVYETKHWKIIENKFPYDKIAKKHHMIIPKRHVKEKNLNKDEIDELYKIKNTYIAKNYHYILEATVGVKSIPLHFHLHLLVVVSN